MPTGVENLISLIQCASLTVVHYIKLFLQAKSAFFGDWVMGLGALQQFPCQLIVFTIVFQIPFV